MNIDTIASALVGLFDAEAAVGLVLLAVVIFVIVHAVFEERQDTGTRDSGRLR